MPIVTNLWRRLVPGARGAAEPPALVAAPAREVVQATNQPLVVRGVQRHFGSLNVLQGIDFEANKGELLSLVGPNGAGKTTLIRCLADGLERSAGDVTVFGQHLGRWPPDRCVALGIGRKFQAANVFATLSVAECLRVARYRHEPPSLWASDTVLSLPEAALRIVEETGLGKALQTEARHLSHGQKQALELAMVLALEPSIVLLDEPTAGLTRVERERIGTILTSLAERERLSILLVEHDLDFVREISSRVIVLHHGRILLDGSVEEVVGSDLVRDIYAGTAYAEAAVQP
jgi:branched-chain amino acid transport system permease protein